MLTRMKPSTVHRRLAKQYPAHTIDWVKQAKWRHDPAVPIDKIAADTRPGGMNESTITGIASAVKSGQPVAPVALVDIGEQKLAVADGYHRIAALTRLGRKTVPAVIASGAGQSGPWAAAMHYAKNNYQLAVQTDLALDLAVVPSPGGRTMNTTPFSTSTTDNWVARRGGLPDYVRGVAHALMAKRGIKDESKAISMAVGIMHNWAHGAGHVHPAVRAAAGEAVAHWDAMRATTKHDLATEAPMPIDLAMNGPKRTSSNSLPPLAKGGPRRFPINNATDVENAVNLVGMAKGNKAMIRRHIIAQAKRVGATHKIPASWTSNGNLMATENAAGSSSSSSSSSMAKPAFGSAAWNAKYGVKKFGAK